MRKILTNGELSVFAGQLAMILHSGISSLEGISIMKDDMPTQEGRDVLGMINDALEETGDLGESLSRAEVFPEYFVKMTEIGERSGTLEEVMNSLASYYGRQETLTKNIRDALVYPLVMLGMLLAVLAVLVSQVMPVFRQVFDQLGVEMTGISNTVFQISGVLQKVSLLLLILIVIFAVVGLISLRSQTGKEKLFALFMKIPFSRKISYLLSCSRFSDALSLALHSGLDMEESFELAVSLNQQPTFLTAAAKARELIQQGTDIGDSLRQAEIITGLNARMLNIGLRTGASEEALRQISLSCEEEAENQIQSVVAAIEPTMTAVLSVVTGVILVSVMLPLLGVMSNIG